jgi:hypothetical protein
MTFAIMQSPTVRWYLRWSINAAVVEVLFLEMMKIFLGRVPLPVNLLLCDAM